MKRIQATVPVTLMFLTLMFAGCGRGKPDFSTKLTDARGLKPESSVFWKGTEIGKVSAVTKESDGKTLVQARLTKEHRGTIPDGVKARAMRSPVDSTTPALILLGKTSANAPPLPRGTIILEASLYEAIQVNPLAWMSSTGYTLYLVAGFLILLVVCWLVWKFAGGLVRATTLITALLLLMAFLWVIHFQWFRYKSAVSSAETGAEVVNFLDSTFFSTDGRDIWNSMRTEVSEISTEASRQGGAARSQAIEKIKALIAKRTSEAKAAGKTQAVKELEQAAELVKNPSE